MFKPLHDVVVVRPDKPKDTTASGIILAQSSKKPMFMGEAIAVGEPCKFVKVGDKVVYTEHTHEKFHYEGEDLALIQEKHLLGIIVD